MSTPETTEKRNKLARDVLLLSRNTLLVNLRLPPAKAIPEYQAVRNGLIAAYCLRG